MNHNAPLVSKTQGTMVTACVCREGIALVSDRWFGVQTEDGIVPGEMLKIHPIGKFGAFQVAGIPRATHALSNSSFDAYLAVEQYIEHSQMDSLKAHKQSLGQHLYDHVEGCLSKMSVSDRSKVGEGETQKIFSVWISLLDPESLNPEFLLFEVFAKDNFGNLNTMVRCGHFGSDSTVTTHTRMQIMGKTELQTELQTGNNQLFDALRANEELMSFIVEEQSQVRANAGCCDVVSVACELIATTHENLTALGVSDGHSVSLNVDVALIDKDGLRFIAANKCSRRLLELIDSGASCEDLNK